MMKLEKEVQDGLCKLYNYDFDGALNMGKIEQQKEIGRGGKAKKEKSQTNKLEQDQRCIVKRCTAGPGLVR